MDTPFIDLQIIAAVGPNLELGKDGKMPWHHPEDLKFFRKTTSNSCVIMGRKTFESIGKPLPNRTNIVVSKTMSDSNPTYMVSTSLEEALRSARMLGKIFIVGGASLYAESLPLANTLWLTRIPNAGKGADTFFPEIPNYYELEESFSLGESGLTVDKYINPAKTQMHRKAPVWIA